MDFQFRILYLDTCCVLSFFYLFFMELSVLDWTGCKGFCLLHTLFTGWIGHCSVLLYCSIINFLYWKKLRMEPLFCRATSSRFWSFLRGGAGNPPFPAGRGVHPWSKCQNGCDMGANFILGPGDTNWLKFWKWLWEIESHILALWHCLQYQWSCCKTF